MKTPKYTLTNLMLKYILKYELAISELNHTELPKTLKKPLIEKLYAEEIDNVAQLVAYPIGYNSALKILRGQEHTTGRSKKKVFNSFKNARDYIRKYSGTTALKPSMELAIHLNKILTKGWNDDWDQGRLKDFSEKPNDLYDTWYTLRDYYPSTNMENHFNELFRWITNSEDNTHKLIQLAILMYEFIEKAPFFAGNQMTSILVLELLTKEYGYNPNIILPFSKAINFISEDLKSAFKISKGKTDLPKGYQISQYKKPICSNGHVELSNSTVEIERIHQEEDVAKSTHHIETDTNKEYSLIDYNKSGVPLIEIVTKPCIRSGEQAKEYATRIRQIARYLNISDADMEKGQMRCEPNISVQKKGMWEQKGEEIVPIGKYKLNAKIEIKNIGSITAVEKSINYEVNRLIEALETNKEIIQQTRGWNANKNMTEFQRSKETSDDYRYMAEPDIPIIETSKENIEEISSEIVELPHERINRYMNKHMLSEYDANVLSTDRDVAIFYDNLFIGLDKHLKDTPTSAKLASNCITGTLFAWLNEKDISISKANLDIADLVQWNL